MPAGVVKLKVPAEITAVEPVKLPVSSRFTVPATLVVPLTVTGGKIVAKKFWI